MLKKTPDEIRQGLKHCSEDGCKGCCYEHDCNMADGFSVLAYDALAYIRQLEAVAPRWISAEERMPEPGTLCMVFGHKHGVNHMDLALRGTTGTWEFAMASSFEITRWMRLPGMPEMKKEE